MTPADAAAILACAALVAVFGGLLWACVAIGSLYDEHTERGPLDTPPSS